MSTSGSPRPQPVTEHPRHQPTTLAGIEINAQVFKSVSGHNLSFAELMSVLSAVISTWSKREVRAERVVGSQTGGGSQ